MALAGLGEGLEPALQGLVAHAVPLSTGQRPRIFAVVAVCDTLSELVGGPATGGLMSIGREGEGGKSRGWNFVFSSAIFAGLMIWGLVVAIFFDRDYECEREGDQDGGNEAADPTAARSSG
ncbi:MAG: hypothetical protein Q9160_002216 [Pyrenula sp. 1 TL-2023]